MRFTITQRMFCALLAISLVTIALNMLVSRWSFQREFLAYKAEQEETLLASISTGLGNDYQASGGWERLQDNPVAWHQLLRKVSLSLTPRPEYEGAGPPGRPPPPPHEARPEATHPPGDGRPPPTDPLNVLERLALYDQAGVLIAGRAQDARSGQSKEIEVAGQVVGRAFLANPKQLTENIDIRFELGQTRSLLLSSLVITLLAVCAALILARQLTRPVQLLAQRTRTLTEGNYEDRLAVDGNSELSELAADVNRLAQTLEDNRRARQAWISDIAHELRTPLAILTAELQAIEDGIRTFNEGSRQSLQFEVQRLNRIVSDLNVLSSSDEGTLSLGLVPTDLNAILRECCNAAAPRLKEQGISLRFVASDVRLLASVDAFRITQMFNILLENTVRYTDAPGEMRVRFEQLSADAVTLIVEDSAPGVPPELHARLFDRLFRVEQSRSRHSGGSGLGLAIFQALARAHNATVQAVSSSLGGLAIRTTFPLLIAEVIDEQS